MEIVVGSSHRRLLMETEASDLPYAKLIYSRFAAERLPTRWIPAAELYVHDWIDRPGTLVVGRRPKSGWITKAEHGVLAVRSDEHYLHPIQGCLSHCTYCYLQAGPAGRRPVRFYVDIDDFFSAIEHQVFNAGRGLLFCTGELADSLADSALFPIGAALVRRFSMGDLGRLELRSKSDKVNNLLNVGHNGRTTVAFSLSPAGDAKRYDPGTASVERRLAAARSASAVGYPIALKFEPLILDDGWQARYRHLLAQIRSFLSPDFVSHVSVGSLRWSPALAAAHAFRASHGNSAIVGELVEYRPNKYNGTLAASARVAAYRSFRDMLREVDLDRSIWWSLEEQAIIDQLAT